MAVLCWAMWPQHYLIIANVSSGKMMLEEAASPGDNIWVIVINSVEGLPVGDHFVISEDYHIILAETIYMAPYAGYIHQEEATVIAPGVTRIPNINQPMDEVTFSAGYVYKHSLFLNGSWVPLYHMAQGGDLIRIRVESRTRLSHGHNKCAPPRRYEQINS